ncbi:DNA photolyase family protein [Ancylobacter sp. MQZ15Z-1]|uniref:Deoxyribodipyrimidine photo-lyase n=1 Tax=Ancylobacter mangrovi TaxID=2972472 RepID=A0A9X2T3E7_9HYPH|nr:deoxyribodipyrimidine photo-lyase [Ancylobacter mangrovi]MCS0493509.1 DNA photolyase family protein [Ancylobacter mangrovi]
MNAPAARPALVWLRDDQRLADNPALDAARRSVRPLVLLHVLEEGPDIRPPGGAARWWLGRSLAALARDLARHGGTLTLRRGDAREILPALVRETGAGAVYWNRRYDSAGVATDTALKAALRDEGIETESFSATLLHEPWTVLTREDGVYRVFTPFYRAARGREVRQPLAASHARWHWAEPPAGDRIEDWRLEPRAADWAGGLRATWTPGEAGARAALERFLEDGIDGYAAGRDRPDRENTSRLSPYLRAGNISPHQIRAALLHAEASGEARSADVEKFLSELYWREFSYHLLFHNPDLATRNFNARFDGFAWQSDAAFERAWQRGLTGFPIVDAGMRQLWQTGWMHNRVRMIAASLLIKQGLVDWRRGEEWFWDTLVDADPANNPASWQWVAGSGADAAPYFRIFNPVLQGEKFDPDGAYIRRFVPEIAALPAKVIHKPWQAPEEVLHKAGIVLGETYPRPALDLDTARRRALERFQRLGKD